MRSNGIVTLLVILTVIVAFGFALQDSQEPVATPLAAFTPLPLSTPSPLPTQLLPTSTPTLLPTNDDLVVEATAVPDTITSVCNTTPADWVAYTIQSGDTLYRIAVNAGITMEEIRQANCLMSDFLVPETQLFVPSIPPTRQPCGPPRAWVRYQVQRGDTIYSLAQRTGDTVYAILNANCLTSSYLVTGRLLYLPAFPVVTATPAPATPLPSNTPLPSQTPVPTETRVPSATPLPTQTATPTASATPLPETATSTPMASPTMTPTPLLPSETPTLPPTPTATDTLVPTNTPVPPTETPTPLTETPTLDASTLTPIPTDTPSIILTSASTETPAP